MRRRRRQLGRTARPNEINGGWVDRYSVMHVASGVVIRLAGKKRVPWWGALLLAVGWELAERPLKSALPSVFAPFDTQDTWQNAAGDVAAVMLGYGLASLLDARDEAWVPS